MRKFPYKRISIKFLVVEYIVAIDVTRVRFPADAFSSVFLLRLLTFALSILISTIHQQRSGAVVSVLGS